MDTDELRALQAPLKDRYRAEPETAKVTLRAEGSLADGVACSLQLCSGDMLLEALVACAGVTLKAVATALGITVDGSVHAEGDLDFRGTLGVDRQVPVGFSAIRLTFDLDTDADYDQRQTLLRLTERYCVVLQTLTNAPSVEVAA